MAQLSSHDPSASAMSLGARAAYVLIPLLAFACVLWIAVTQPLPADLQAVLTGLL